MLSLGLIGVSMSDWRLVEHKEICCLMFSWAVGLKTLSVLYKVFLNESFSECLSNINNFVMSYCMLDSKLVWSRDTILSEDGLTASNLWSCFASNISLSNHSINSIDFEIFRFYTLIIYYIDFSWMYETVVCILVKQGLLLCLSRVVISHAHSGQLIEFLKASCIFYRDYE
jgi:hypothetical protein